MTWILVGIAAWLAGAAATRVLVELVSEYVGDYDGGVTLCNPILPFWPLVAMACVTVLPFLFWEWLTGLGRPKTHENFSLGE